MGINFLSYEASEALRLLCSQYDHKDFSREVFIKEFIAWKKRYGFDNKDLH